MKRRGVGYEGQGKSGERRRLSVGEIGKLLDKNRDFFLMGCGFWYFFNFWICSGIVLTFDYPVP